MEKYFDINQGGYSVRCKIYANDVRSVKRVTVFCHGFGGHKDNRSAAKFAGHLLSKYKDAGVIVFDWPCHGTDARKKLTLSECDTYLGLVVQYAKEQLHVEDLCAYGTSFGGYLLLKYIDEHDNPFRRIVLRSPAVRMYETLYVRITAPSDRQKLEKGKEIDVGFDRKVRLGMAFFDELKAQDITVRDFTEYADDIFVIHGTKDEIVPYAYAEEFCDNNIIELMTVENADHRFSDPGKLDAANNAAMKWIME